MYMIELGTAIKKTLDRVKDGILLIDREFSIVFVNKAAAKMFDKNEQDIIGQNCSSIFIKSPRPDQTAPPFQCPCSEVLDTGASVSTLYRHIIPSAEEKVLQITASPVINENGGIIQVLEIIRDVTEEKRSEEALRRSEQKLQSVFSNMQDIFYRTDTGGRVVWVTPSALKILGYDSLDELIGRDLATDFYATPEKRQVFLDELSKKGKVTDYEIGLRKKDGSTITVSTNSQYYFDKDGKVAGVEGVCRDISKRKKAEKALRESRRKYQQLIDHARNPITFFDRDGICLSINPKGAKNLGGSSDDFVGKSLKDMFSPELAEKYMERNKKVIDSGEGADFEDVIDLPKGKKWFWSNLQPIRDHAGDVCGVQIISYDITERKNADDKLRTAISQIAGEKAKTEAIISSIGDALGIVDNDFRIIYQNEVSKKIFGDHIGRHCYAAYQNKQKKCEECPVHSSIIEDRIQRVERKRSDGNGTMFLEITTSPLKDADGKIIGGVEVVRDITDRKKAEQEAVQYGERLRILREIDHAILTAQSTAKIVRVALNYLKELVSCIRASIVTFDLKAGYADVVALYSEGRTTDGERRRISLDEYKIEDCLYFGEVDVVDDLQAVPELPAMRQSLKDEGVRAFISVPIIHLDELIGAINIGRGMPSSFTSEDVTITGEIADLLAVAIQSGRAGEELRSSEKALRESEVFLASILEGIKDGVVVLDKEFKILFANNAYKEQTGSLSEKVKGRFCYELFHGLKEPCFLKGHECLVKNVLDSGISSRDTRRKGERFMEMTVYPLKNSSGEITSAVEIRRDVTRNIEMDEELKERVRELEDFYAMAVGRELKMKQLKSEITSLQEELDRRGKKAGL